MKKLGIFYISTGKYTIFWQDFFLSAEQYFLRNSDVEVNYFVFTDSDFIKYEHLNRVHKIHQESLPWPLITLDRFSIFQKAKPAIYDMEYLFFFNANMNFVKPVGTEILPDNGRSLTFVIHPGYWHKDKSKYTYERNIRSTAAVKGHEGTFYFMGGLNGGTASAYIQMIEHLERQISIDKSNNIVAKWHDESHLNRYAIDHSDSIKVLDPSYGYPEGWNLPCQPKIVIRNKAKYGGHAFLRNEKKPSLKKFINYFSRKIS
jgi:hypothetical protein